MRSGSRALARLALAALAVATAAAARRPAGASPPQPVQANAQPGATPQAGPPGPPGPAAAASEPAAEAASFAQRPAPQCADFRAGAGATWRALASVSFPGPQGPVRVTAGQVISPGAYVSGLDLAAILQARCF